MKVYIVTSGQYSDYGISAVFIDEDAADAYADRRNRADGYGGGDYRVEVYDTDDVQELPRTDHIAFRVTYSPPTGWLGAMGNGWFVFGDVDLTELPFEDVQAAEVRAPLSIGDGSKKTQWETWVWAKDQRAARKIGADRIMPVLAAAEIEFILPDQPAPFDRTDTPFINMMTIKAHPGTVKIGDYTSDKQEWGMAVRSSDAVPPGEVWIVDGGEVKGKITGIGDAPD